VKKNRQITRTRNFNTPALSASRSITSKSSVGPDPCGTYTG
jgi:hypothetical protein